MRLTRHLARPSRPLVVALLIATFTAGTAAAQSAPRADAPAASQGAARAHGPRERQVLASHNAYEAAVLAGDTVTLKRLWAEDYTFVNARGLLVTRAQRLANFASGATEVAEALNRREITVKVYGDMAVLRQLFTLRGRYSGRLLDTEVRCTFVWLWRAGRWQMVTNQLTPVAA